MKSNRYNIIDTTNILIMNSLNEFELKDIISFISLDTRLILVCLNKCMKDYVGKIKYKECSIFCVKCVDKINFEKAYYKNVGLNGSTRMYNYLNNQFKEMSGVILPNGLICDFSGKKSELYALACEYNHYDFIDEHIDWINEFENDEIYYIYGRAICSKNYAILEHLERKNPRFNLFKIWSYDGKPITDIPPYITKYFWGACLGNDLVMVKKILRIYPNFIPEIIHVCSACTQGCGDVVKFLLNIISIHEAVFVHACQGGLDNIVDDVLASHNYNQNYIDNGFAMACSNGKLSIAKKLKDIGLSDGTIDVAFSYCFHEQYMPTIEYLLSLGVTDINIGFESVCRSEDKKMAEYLVSLGANNWNFGLKTAYETCGLSMIDYMLEKGATNLQELIESTEKMTSEQQEIRVLMSYAYVKSKKY